MSCNSCGGCANCGSLQGLGQTPAATPPATSSSWTPWVIGGLAAVAAGGIIYVATRHAVPHEAFHELYENPTRKKTPGAYQAAIANMLAHRYGFSYNKAYAAVNDEEIGWKIAWFFQHNYNVSYATKMIHRRARRKLYGPWREGGYMPLGKAAPPLPGGAAPPEAAPGSPPDEASLRAQYG